MSKPIEAVVINQNGWWSVVCREMDVSGFGASEPEALAAFQTALFSTLAARIHHEAGPSSGVRQREAVLPGMRMADTARSVVRRIPLAVLEPAGA